MKCMPVNMFKTYFKHQDEPQKPIINIKENTTQDIFEKEEPNAEKS